MKLVVEYRGKKFGFKQEDSGDCHMWEIGGGKDMELSRIFLKYASEQNTMYEMNGIYWWEPGINGEESDGEYRSENSRVRGHGMPNAR